MKIKNIVSKIFNKYTLIGLVVVLVIMQFFPIDKTNPPVDIAKDYITLAQPPTKIVKLLKDACYDCHSNEVKYPWYTSVAPISWWIKGHIDHGRKHLNFSIWGDYSDKKKNHKLEECVEFVEETRMPLLSYIIAHPEARMSEEDRAELVEWFRNSL